MYVIVLETRRVEVKLGLVVSGRVDRPFPFTAALNAARERINGGDNCLLQGGAQRTCGNA